MLSFSSEKCLQSCGKLFLFYPNQKEVSKKVQGIPLAAVCSQSYQTGSYCDTYMHHRSILHSSLTMFEQTWEHVEVEAC